MVEGLTVKQRGMLNALRELPRDVWHTYHTLAEKLGTSSGVVGVRFNALYRKRGAYFPGEDPVLQPRGTWLSRTLGVYGVVVERGRFRLLSSPKSRATLQHQAGREYAQRSLTTQLRGA